MASGQAVSGNCLFDVVRTLGLKPRMPLSTGATFDNLLEIIDEKFPEMGKEIIIQAQES